MRRGHGWLASCSAARPPHEVTTDGDDRDARAATCDAHQIPTSQGELTVVLTMVPPGTAFVGSIEEAKLPVW